MRRAFLLLTLLTGFLLAAGQPVALRIAGPEFELIGPTGQREFRVELFSPEALPSGSLRAELHGLYGLDYHRTVNREFSGGKNAGEERFSFDALPAGLYEWTVTAVDSDGKRLDAASTLAVAAEALPAGAEDLGVCTHLGRWKHQATLLDLTRFAGFSRIRDEVYWDVVERERGKFVYPGELDLMIREAASRQLKPLLILDYGNAKVYPELFQTSGFPDNDGAHAAFLRYVENTVTRYPEVKDWELWNEPNSVNPANVYLPLLRKVYAAIKAIDPGATVISCGGGGAGGGPGGGYIVPIVDAGGVDAQDAFSIHPYMAPHEPDRGYGPCIGSPIEYVNVPDVWRHLGRYVQDNRRSDGKPLELWVTEIGWPTGRAEQGRSEFEQAAYLARTFLQHRRAGTAKALFFYDLLSDGDREGESEHNFGILRPDFSPKPAYAAIATAVRQLGNQKASATLEDGENLKVFRFGDVTALYCREKGVDYELALPGVARATVTDWHGASRTVEVKDGKLKLKLSPAPTYVKVVK